MSNLSLLQKKYLLLRMKVLVERLTVEGILTLKQAELAYQLTAQEITDK